MHEVRYLSPTQSPKKLTGFRWDCVESVYLLGENWHANNIASSSPRICYTSVVLSYSKVRFTTDKDFLFFFFAAIVNSPI